MKKWILALSLLCVLLCGCSAKDTSGVTVEDAAIYEYNEESVTLRHRIGDGLRLYIKLSDLVDGEGNSEVFILNPDGELIVDETMDDIFKSEIELKFNSKRDKLTVVEHITYFDENNKENNFTYDKTVELSYMESKGNFHVSIEENGTQDIKWNVIANINSIKDSLQYGLYNMFEVSYIVGFTTIAFSVFVIVFTVYVLLNFSLARERKFKFEPWIDVLILSMWFFIILLLAFKGEPPVIITFFNVLLFIFMLVRLLILLIKLPKAILYKHKQSEIIE